MALAVTQKVSQSRPGCHEQGKRSREILAWAILGTSSGTGSGTAPWRDGPMTSPPSPWHSNAVIGENWPLLARLARGSNGTAELAALPASRWARVRWLCRRAHHDERAALTLLFELSPELASVRRRLERHGLERDEAEGAYPFGRLGGRLGSSFSALPALAAGSV